MTIKKPLSGNVVGQRTQNTLKSNSSTASKSTTKNTTSGTAKTTNTSGTTNATRKISGVDDNLSKILTSPFSGSTQLGELDKKSNSALGNAEKLVGTSAVKNSTLRALEKDFKIPSAVREADAYLSEQLEKIQSGRTSYSDQVRDMLDQIRNREKFSYDVDQDPLFQQALASAMGSGKQAMQDTIGQASALTGGYASTYATSAGNQAYNAFIEDAYDNLPQYYQMAMEKYQMEGDEMYRQYSMLSAEDDKEYNRNIAAYDATFAHRNQLYNEAYSQYRDDKSDAFSMANLDLSIHNQKVSDAFNYYNAVSEAADTRYQREYNDWLTSIENAWKEANFTEGIRQYEKNFAEDVRQFDTSFAENQRQYNETMAENKRQHDAQMSYNYAALAQDNAQFYAQLNSRGSGGSGGSGGLRSSSYGGGYDYSAEALEKASNSKAVSSFKANVLTNREFSRRGKAATSGGKTIRYDSYNEYIDDKLEQWNKNGKLTEIETAYLIGYYFG